LPGLEIGIVETLTRMGHFDGRRFGHVHHTAAADSQDQVTVRLFPSSRGADYLRVRVGLCFVIDRDRQARTLQQHAPTAGRHSFRQLGELSGAEADLARQKIVESHNDPPPANVVAQRIIDTQFRPKSTRRMEASYLSCPDCARAIATANFTHCGKKLLMCTTDSTILSLRR